MQDFFHPQFSGIYIYINSIGFDGGCLQAIGDRMGFYGICVEIISWENNKDVIKYD
jgi:hypothetical protein